MYFAKKMIRAVNQGAVNRPNNLETDNSDADDSINRNSLTLLLDLSLSEIVILGPSLSYTLSFLTWIPYYERTIFDIDRVGEIICFCLITYKANCQRDVGN